MPAFAGMTEFRTFYEFVKNLFMTKKYEIRISSFEFVSNFVLRIFFIPDS